MSFTLTPSASVNQRQDDGRSVSSRLSDVRMCVRARYDICVLKRVRSCEVRERAYRSCV